MNDLAAINIPVNFKQLNDAAKAAVALDGSLDSASNSAIGFARAMSRLERDLNLLRKIDQQGRDAARTFQNLVNSTNGIGRSFKSASDSASIFTTELRKMEAQAEKTARANQDAFNSQLGVNRPSATSGGASFSAMEGEIERLRTKYDQVYAASQFYERSLNELDRAQRMGAISADIYTRELDQLNMEFQQFQNGVGGVANRFNQLEYATQGSRRGFAQVGMVMQQTGYQVGDFIVQIQSGTNAWVAAGQQLTQLAGLLFLIPGQVGIIAGVVASILIPLGTAIGGYFSRTKEAKKGTDEFAEALKGLKESASGIETALSGIRLGFANSEQTAAYLELEKVTRDLAVAQEAYNEAVRASNENEASLQLSGVVGNRFKELDALREKQRLLQEEYDKYVQLAEIQDRIRASGGEENRTEELSNQLAIQEQINQYLAQGVPFVEAKAQAEFDVAQQLLNQLLTQEGLTEEQRAAIRAAQENLAVNKELERQIREAEAQTERLKGAMERAKEQAQLLLDVTNAIKGVVSEIASIDLSGVFSRAASAAESFGQKAWDFLGEAGRTGSFSLAGNVYSSSGLAPTRSPRPKPAPVEGTSFMAPSGRSGSSGGATKQEEDLIAKLQQEIALKEKLATLDQAEREFLETKQGIIQQLGDQAARLSDAEIEAYAKRMQAAEESLNRQIELENKLQEAREWAANSMTNLWQAAFQGAEAFRQQLANIILELARMAAQEAFMRMFGQASKGSPGTWLGAVLGFKNGGAFSGGRVIPFANGGVVSSPTNFPMTGNNMGLMGEAGPEAIVPLRRGQDGKLGVESPQPVVNQKIINVLDPSIVGDYLATDAGERVVMNVLRKNGVTGR